MYIRIVLIKIYNYKLPSKKLGVISSEIYIIQLEKISEILLDFYVWEIGAFLSTWPTRAGPTLYLVFIRLPKGYYYCSPLCTFVDC